MMIPNPGRSACGCRLRSLCLPRYKSKAAENFLRRLRCRLRLFPKLIPVYQICTPQDRYDCGCETEYWQSHWMFTVSTSTGLILVGLIIWYHCLWCQGMGCLDRIVITCLLMEWAQSRACAALSNPGLSQSHLEPILSHAWNHAGLLMEYSWIVNCSVPIIGYCLYHILALCANPIFAKIKL